MKRKTWLALRVAALEGIVFGDGLPRHRSLWYSSSTRLGSKLLSARSIMKLDATDLRYITSDEFRVLTAV